MVVDMVTTCNNCLKYPFKALAKKNGSICFVWAYVYEYHGNRFYLTPSLCELYQ